MRAQKEKNIISKKEEQQKQNMVNGVRDVLRMKIFKNEILKLAKATNIQHHPLIFCCFCFSIFFLLLFNISFLSVFVKLVNFNKGKQQHHLKFTSI